jgi:hypothetical protein
MAARKKSTTLKKKAKSAPARKPPAKKLVKLAKRKPAAKKVAAPRKKPAVKHLLPVPDSRETALAWFSNLSNRIADAGIAELQALVGEARTYDLVGLNEVLGDDAQVLALNRAANELIQAALDTVGPASAQGFQLQVLRDILNDS